MIVTASRERRMDAHIDHAFAAAVGQTLEGAWNAAKGADQMSIQRPAEAPCAVDLATACKVLPET